MNNTVFNRQLYIQTLKKIGLAGSVLAMLCYLATMIITISAYDNSWNNYDITPVIMSPQLFVFVYLCSIILTISAFSFVNKRNSSDFYFSLPNTRVCTFISTASAVVTWAVGTVITTVLLSSFGYLVVGYTVEITDVLVPIAYFTMVTLMAIGSTAFGISITGTVFSNIIATGLIVFLPRAVISFVQAIVLESASILPNISVFGVFDPQYNMVISAAWAQIEGGVNDTFFMQDPLAYLYSGIVMLLYFACGVIAFKMRKSETAGKSAPNRVIQGFYRSALTTPVIFLFFTLIVIDTSVDSVVLLALFATAFSVYVIYEAVTTKSIKNIVKSLPLFVALVFVIGITSVCAKITGERIVQYVPEVEDIVSVSIHTEYESGYTYLDTSKVEFTEEEIIAIAAEALNKTIDSMNDDYTYYEIYGESYSTVTVKYDLGTTTMYRRVRFSDDEETRISNLMEQNEEYLEAKTQLPSLDEIETISMSYLDNREVKEVYQCFLEDFENADLETKMEIVENDSGLGSIGIYITSYNGSRTFWNSYYLSPLTPTALDKYLELSDNAETIEESLMILDNYECLKSIYISYYLPTDPSEYGYSFSIAFYNENDSTYEQKASQVKTILENASTRKSGEGYISAIVDMEYALPYNEMTGEYEITTVTTVTDEVTITETATEPTVYDYQYNYISMVYYLTEDELNTLNYDIGGK